MTVSIPPSRRSRVLPHLERVLPELLLTAALCAALATPGRAQQQPSGGLAATRRQLVLEHEMDTLLVASDRQLMRDRLDQARASLARVDRLYAEYGRLGVDSVGLQGFENRLQRGRENLAIRSDVMQRTAAPAGQARAADTSRAAAAASRTAAAVTPPIPAARTDSAPAGPRSGRAETPRVSVAPEETRAPAPVPLGELDQNAAPRRPARDARGERFLGWFRDRPLLLRIGTLAVVLLGLGALLTGLVVARRRRLPHAAAKGKETMSANVVRVGQGLVTLGNSQHIGARAEQQDAFGFSDTEDAQRFPQLGIVAALADGMGGMALGAQASNTALRLFLQSLPRLAASGAAAPDVLHQALADANRGVVELAAGAALQDQVGTTFAAVTVAAEGVYWISAGDTRIYLFRDGQLHQLNSDHNYARKLTREVALGRMSAEEAAAHEDREAITSFLGQAQVSEIDQNRRAFPLQEGDHLILCSDGIYGTLGDEEMARVVAEHPGRITEHLVARVRAIQRPGQDNMTALVLSYGGATAPVPTRWVRSTRARPVGAL